MMLPVFLAAAFALLAVPGPTNTLLCLAGAQHGAGRAMRLVPVELLGYLCAVLPLAWLGRQAFAQSPGVETAVTLVAAGWILSLAIRLWSAAGRPGAGGAVTSGRLWLTTLLNPKALVFALVLLPPMGNAAFAPHLAAWSLLVLAIGCAWVLAGALVRSRGGEGGQGRSGRTRTVQRLSAVWLAAVSLGLLAGALGRP